MVRGPYYLPLGNQPELEHCFRKIGCEKLGVQIMEKKGAIFPLLLKEVKSPCANILKQHMLSLGGEAAVSRGVVNCSQEYTDVLLLGTPAVYERLVDKLAQQPWGLSALAEKITRLLETGINRPRKVVWEWPGRKLVLGERTLVMGILNVTPDSFSDGGKYQEVHQALAHAQSMVEAGADLIDVGGESTRPGYTVVSEEEELARIMPVLEKLLAEIPLPVSIDTSKSRVAEEALVAGVHIINYEGAGDDARMAEVVARYQAPVMIMHHPKKHAGGDFGDDDVVPDVLDSLEEKIKLFETAGAPPEKIVVDPGIGFGKSQEENLLVLKRLKSLRTLGKPVLLGASRKSFLGHILGLPVEERLEGSLAAAAWGALQGADILRVHDVRETVRLLKVLEAIKKTAD